MKKEFEKLTMVEIFGKLIWPKISNDRRFKRLLKGRKTRIKNTVEIELRDQKDKSSEIVISLFWGSVYGVYREDRKEPGVSPYISKEINNIIKKVFEQEL